MFARQRIAVEDRWPPRPDATLTNLVTRTSPLGIFLNHCWQHRQKYDQGWHVDRDGGPVTGTSRLVAQSYYAISQLCNTKHGRRQETLFMHTHNSRYPAASIFIVHVRRHRINSDSPASFGLTMHEYGWSLVQLDKNATAELAIHWLKDI